MCIWLGFALFSGVAVDRPRMPFRKTFQRGSGRIQLWSHSVRDPFTSGPVLGRGAGVGALGHQDWVPHPPNSRRHRTVRGGDSARLSAIQSVAPPVICGAGAEAVRAGSLRSYHQGVEAAAAGWAPGHALSASVLFQVLPPAHCGRIAAR